VPYNDARQRQRLPDLPLGGKSKRSDFYQQVQASAGFTMFVSFNCPYRICAVFVLIFIKSAVNVVLPARDGSDPKEEAIPEQYVCSFAVSTFELVFSCDTFQIRQRYQGWQAYD
jgi:hypothetical protein